MGSKQTQVGVLWGKKDNNVIACLARGKEFTDQKLPDGSWYYFGQGAKGDQSWNFANQLIRDKQIYLFNNLGPSAIDKNRKRKKNRYEYIGLFFCDHWEYIISKDKKEGSNVSRLKKLGIKIKIGHRSSNIKNSSLVVYSSAIKNL